jgi:hypothetical protein
VKHRQIPAIQQLSKIMFGINVDRDPKNPVLVCLKLYSSKASNSYMISAGLLTYSRTKRLPDFSVASDLFRRFFQKQEVVEKELTAAGLFRICT